MILTTFSVISELSIDSLYTYAPPVTVAERSKACTVFARSDAGIVGSNPTQGMDVCVCVRFSVFVYRYRPCDELITRPRSPTECLRSSKPK
jgi:hypothetical protein